MSHISIEIVEGYRKKLQEALGSLGDRRDWNGANDAENSLETADQILKLLRAALPVMEKQQSQPAVDHDTIFYARGVWLRVSRSTGNLLLDIPDENGKPSTTNVIVPKSAVKLLREAFALAAENDK